ncbi:hypothetical protein LIER_14141 [Lithospermum erythrorhizon]|uniref:Uncharacterized protein n=1 Tax=Lithospermum erythrorhizon TaxID=34254 RepID=A0AAV3PYH3_LITER
MGKFKESLSKKRPMGLEEVNEHAYKYTRIKEATKRDEKGRGKHLMDETRRKPSPAFGMRGRRRRLLEVGDESGADLASRHAPGEVHRRLDKFPKVIWDRRDPRQEDASWPPQSASKSRWRPDARPRGYERLQIGMCAPCGCRRRAQRRGTRMRTFGSCSLMRRIRLSSSR